MPPVIHRKVTCDLTHPTNLGRDDRSGATSIQFLAQRTIIEALASRGLPEFVWHRNMSLKT